MTIVKLCWHNFKQSAYFIIFFESSIFYRPTYLSLLKEFFQNASFQKQLQVALTVCRPEALDVHDLSQFHYVSHFARSPNLLNKKAKKFVLFSKVAESTNFGSDFFPLRIHFFILNIHLCFHRFRPQNFFVSSRIKNCHQKTSFSLTTSKSLL